MNVPIFAIAGRNPWRKFTPLVLRETVLFPLLGFLGLIGIWWIIAIFRSELMPTPLEALNNNLHSKYRTKNVGSREKSEN